MYSFRSYRRHCPPLPLSRVGGWFSRIAIALEARQRAEVLAVLDPRMFCDIGADDIVQTPDARSLATQSSHALSVELMLLRGH